MEKETEQQLKQWNDFYGNVKTVHFDDWLEKYLRYFPQTGKNETILDLGCGNGGNARYLFNKGYRITACDYSTESLNNIKSLFNLEGNNLECSANIITKLFDMREAFPFIDEEVSTIIADLSLHYFSEKKTEEIIGELYRILKKDGYVLARLNSTADINFGAGSGTEIEKNYYLINGNYKRFFDEKTIVNYFANWKIITMKEYGIKRYGDKEKILWEVVLTR